MTEFKHYGLYFDAADAERARKNAQREPYKTALVALYDAQPADALGAGVVAASRYRLAGDEAAGGAAAAHLLAAWEGAQPDGQSYVEVCERLIAAAHAFEMIREELPEETRHSWLRACEARVEALHASDNERTPLDRIWRTALSIIGGIVLENPALFAGGVTDFKQVVSTGIHPEGYLPALVESSSGGALGRQVSGAKALSLAAEAAYHQGVDLWNHEARGISVKTAAIYAAAYYEYREQWPWDAPPDEEANDVFYRANGAFLEMLNRQLRPVVLKSTLVLLRPLQDPLGGGMTTLSHAEPQTRGLFGFGG